MGSKIKLTGEIWLGKCVDYETYFIKNEENRQNYISIGNKGSFSGSLNTTLEHARGPREIAKIRPTAPGVFLSRLFP